MRRIDADDQGMFDRAAACLRERAANEPRHVPDYLQQHDGEHHASRPVTISGQELEGYRRGLRRLREVEQDLVAAVDGASAVKREAVGLRKEIQTLSNQLHAAYCVVGKLIGTPRPGRSAEQAKWWMQINDYVRAGFPASLNAVEGAAE